MSSVINILYNGNYDHSVYQKYFSRFFDKVNMIKYNRDVVIRPSVDLILITGDTNVNPKYYNDSIGNKNLNIDSDRDTLERHMINDYKNIPRLGINRGAIFLTAMSGGNIVQTVSGHNCGKHESEYPISYLQKKMMKLNKTYMINSNHTELMFPYNLKDNDYDIYLISRNYLSDKYKDGRNNDVNISNTQNFYEPEIVLYNNTNSLCIQGEFDEDTTDYNYFCYALINKILKTKK